MNRTIRQLGIAAFLALAASSAAAHVVLEKTEAQVGAGYKAVFKITHGCEGSATTEVRIDIPEGVIAVKPMPKAGWTISLENKPYKRSYAFYHGKKLSEGVRQVTWRGGPLPDSYYDEFVLSTYIARELKPGPIYFPVTQKCELGEMAWTEIPAEGQDPHDLEHPAPQLTLVAKQDRGSNIAAGDIKIASPWSSATPGAPATPRAISRSPTPAASPTCCSGASQGRRPHRDARDDHGPGGRLQDARGRRRHRDQTGRDGGAESRWACISCCGL